MPINKDNIRAVEDLGVTFSHIVGNEAYCFCPFHKDRHASLCVSLGKPVWYCHSSSHVGVRGGGFKTLQKLLDNSSIYNAEDDDILDKAKEPEVEYRIARIPTESFPTLESAENSLYLENRGFSRETIKLFDIRKTTLFIVIPVKNASGKVVGLIIRAILSGWKPKYQYSKGFRKANTLFGLDKFQAKDDIIILVEGSLDAIRMHQNGYTNTLAVLGSSLSEIQIDILRKLGSKIFLFLDPDNAGKEATKDLAEQLSTFTVYVPNYDIYVLDDPAEKDKEEVQRILDSKMPYLKARIEGRI